MDDATGRAKGGIARAKSLSPEQRRAIGQKGAAARWGGDIKQATHGSEDHPLKIGDIEIPCYVLKDETRVLAQRGVMAGLNLGRGSTSGVGGDRLQRFSTGKAISPFVSKELMEVIESPIRFRPPHGGQIAFGYPATILPDICDAILAARRAGTLQKQQEHIAVQCEILLRAFARVGIIALVDEATGYQKDRARDALAEILEQFIAKELRPYIRMFPSAFYEHLFRLRGLEFPRDTGKKPQYFGHLTNDIVYSRLAPGVLEELRRTIPRREDGRKKHPFTRWLTEDVGHPKLREHLASVVTIMKLSDEYDDFEMKLDRIHPRYDRTIPLPLQDARGKPL
jgi:hypothetical protein